MSVNGLVKIRNNVFDRSSTNGTFSSFRSFKMTHTLSADATVYATYNHSQASGCEHCLFVLQAIGSPGAVDETRFLRSLKTNHATSTVAMSFVPWMRSHLQQGSILQSNLVRLTLLTALVWKRIGCKPMQQCFVSDHWYTIPLRMLAPVE